VKVFVVLRQNLEIARMPLVQERFLVGRSPHCEVVARAPGISPVHFMVEWIGEGSFDPKGGIWTIYDLTKVVAGGENQLLEGIVLSEEDEFDYGGLKIKIVDGGLESAHDFKGGITRSLEERRKPGGAKELLEMVFMRRDSSVIERITYMHRKKSGKIKQHLESDYTDLKFKWNNRLLKIDSRLPDNCQLMKGAEAVQLSSGGLDAMPLRDEDFWTIKTPTFSVYLRFVPQIRIAKVKRESKVAPGFWFKYWMIVLGGFSLVLLIYYFVYAAGEKVPEPPPRIARIEIQDFIPPPEPAPVAETVTETPLAEKAEAKLTEKKEEKAATPIQKKAEKESAAAQALPKKEKSKSDVGLRSEAPVKNVNQVGLLGAFTKAPGEGRISADKLMSNTAVPDIAAGNTGRVAVKTPPSGALGISKPGQRVGASGKDGFTGASTTVSSDKVFDSGSTGPIARGKSNAKGFTLGTGAGGQAGEGSTKSFGDLGGSELAVSGGLDKETVRRVINQHKRQIKACYDQQLMLQPNLEGRIRVDWVISSTGRVQTAGSTANTTRSSPLESCLLTVVRSMIFPEAKNGQNTRVIYPWQFTR
jgi:hypothetical protein